MTALDILNLIESTISQHWWLVLVVLSLIEITPIKVNPLRAIFKLLGRLVNGELYSKVDKLGTEIHVVKREFEIKNANDKRWDILDFANSCRNGRRHCKQEWDHVISQLKEYETYVHEHKIDNGVIKEETEYLRELYREISRRNDFL